MLHAGFTKISLSRKKNPGFADSSEGVGRKERMTSTTDRYRAGILDGHRDRQIRRLQLPSRGVNKCTLSWPKVN